MGTRKNDINKCALGAYEHQRKIRANGHFAIDVYGYRGLMSTWKKGVPGQMALGEMSIAGILTLGEMGTEKICSECSFAPKFFSSIIPISS